MNHFHIPGLGLFLVGLCYGINVKCPQLPCILKHWVSDGSTDLGKVVETWGGGGLVGGCEPQKGRCQVFSL